MIVALAEIGNKTQLLGAGAGRAVSKTIAHGGS